MAGIDTLSPAVWFAAIGEIGNPQGIGGAGKTPADVAGADWGGGHSTSLAVRPVDPSTGLRCCMLGPPRVAGVRALVQRVSRASVVVGDELVGEIGTGLCVFVGVTHDDGPAQADRLVDKLADLRLMDDAAGVMNRSVVDVGGAVLVVSQFTLYGDTSKGRRPTWMAAAPPDRAEPLVNRVVAGLRERGLEVATGRFQADMVVNLANEGPATLMLEV